jgi:hypothetical protein
MKFGIYNSSSVLIKGISMNAYGMEFGIAMLNI